MKPKQIVWEVVVLLLVSGFAVGVAALWEYGGWGVGDGSVYLLYAGFWSLLLVPWTVFRYSRPKAIVLASMYVALFVLWAIPWTTPKRFGKDVYSLRIGTPVAQVRTQLEPWVKGTDWEASTKKFASVRSDDPWNVRDGTLFFPGWIVYHGTHWQTDLNADIWEIHVKDGKVSGIEYMPD